MLHLHFGLLLIVLKFFTEEIPSVSLAVPRRKSCRAASPSPSSREGMSPGRRGRRPLPTGLTCLKQKGMVRTLTPTMLFTMFVISPQLEAAAAVIAWGLGAREPQSKAPGRRRGARS